MRPVSAPHSHNSTDVRNRQDLRLKIFSGPVKTALVRRRLGLDCPVQ